MVRTHDSKTEKLFVEDLAALERLNDETIFDEVKNRFRIGSTYSFIGDVLLSLNPNKSVPVYEKKVMMAIFSFWISSSKNFKIFDL